MIVLNCLTIYFLNSIIILDRKNKLKGCFIMTISKKDQIIDAAVSILVQSGKKGKQYRELMDLFKAKFPEFPENTIHGTTWKLHKETDEIKKIGRGHFVHKSFLPEKEMEGDGSSTISEFLKRKEYNIMVEYLEEFKVDFDTIGIDELSELDEESFEKFNFLLKVAKLLK